MNGNNDNNIYNLKTEKLLSEAKVMVIKYFQEYTINNPCAIFDIDDTLFFFADKGSSNYVDNFIPNTPVIDFYKWLHNMGLPIYIITARPNNDVTISATIQLLDAYGLKYEKVFFRPEQMNDVNKFKSGSREYIQRVLKNTNLVSVGDMLWDVNSYVFIPVLLPNVNNLTIPYNYNLLN